MECLGRIPRTGFSSHQEGREPRQQDVIPAALLLERQGTKQSGMTLEEQAKALRCLVKDLRRYESYIDKLAVCESHPVVRRFLSTGEGAIVLRHLSRMDAESAFVICCTIAIGQEHVLMGLPSNGAVAEGLAALAERLVQVEEFYDNIGGLAGYQLECVEILLKNALCENNPLGLYGETNGADCRNHEVQYLVPPGLDLEGETTRDRVADATVAGIRGLPFMAEIYPLGGAGDRLGLQCETTGDCLPTAMLDYCGRSLLETLIRDLQAREYLHFRLFGVQSRTPVAVMTSAAKGNHWRVAQLFEEARWFGRGQDSFMLFQQPLVPVVGGDDGKWLLPETLSPEMKPGGHGVIWKLMLDAGVFHWFENAGRTAAIIRQISNPMAGQDRTLLALSGEGLSGKKAFGFASCERVVGAAEGMNVLLKERIKPSESHHHVDPLECPSSLGPTVEDSLILRNDHHDNASCGLSTARPSVDGFDFSYRITNVEYTEFERLGIKDQPATEGSNHSLFPANTNVLFVGLKAVEKVLHMAIASESASAVLPGLILNTKKEVSYTDALTGVQKRVHAGRLECTMQNLADSFGTVLRHDDISVFPHDGSDLQDTPASSVAAVDNNDDDVVSRVGTSSVAEEEMDLSSALSTFLVYGPRRKVTSSAKRRRSPDSLKIHQTPDGSLYDLMLNARDMLSRCGFDVPPVGNVETYLSRGPGFLFLFHPAIGPLWDVVTQKLRGGSLSFGSEVQLEVAEADIRNLDVDGSLRVISTSPLGHMVGENGEEGGKKLMYSDRCGRIRLHDVRVNNRGVDWEDPNNVYWRHRVARTECCKIVLNGSAQFEARGVTLEGDLSFEVPDGCVMMVEPGIEEGVPLSVTVREIDRPLWFWKYELDDDAPERVKLTMVESGDAAIE